MTDLRQAAQQALEALDWHYRQGHSNTLGGLRLKIDEKALRSLRTALEQQAEPTQWRDMVVVTLVREGINKHKARELADHFATPPQRP